MVPTINLSEGPYRELGRYGNRDESWNVVMARVLEHVDEDAALADKRSRRTEYSIEQGEEYSDNQNSGESALRKLADGTTVQHRYQRGNYSGAEVEARVSNGKIEFEGQSYSPSRAALVADQSVRGPDSASSLNGWEWWEYEDENGEWVMIDDLRE